LWTSARSLFNKEPHLFFRSGVSSGISYLPVRKERKQVYQYEIYRGLTSGRLPESQEQEKGFIRGVGFLPAVKGYDESGEKCMKILHFSRYCFPHSDLQKGAPLGAKPWRLSCWGKRSFIRLLLFGKSQNRPDHLVFPCSRRMERGMLSISQGLAMHLSFENSSCRLLFIFIYL